MEDIDIETPRGLAAFFKLADESEAYSDATGMGHQSDKELLEAIAFNLRLPHYTDEDDEGNYETFRYSGDVAGADLLQKYARDSIAWTTHPGVRAILERLAKHGHDKQARELIRRVKDQPGLCSGDAAIRYCRIKEAAAHARGNRQLANVYRRLTRDPKLAVDFLVTRPAAVRDGRPIKRTLQHSRKAGPAALLARFRACVADCNGNEPQARKKLAADEGMTPKCLKDRLRNARKSEAKSLQIE